jgi:hypothetical protein
LFVLYLLYTLLHVIKTLLSLMYVPVVFATIVPDDDGQRSADEDHRPSRSQTPPTPPVQAEPSQSPPPSPRPMRQRAMAQLRPVSIPEIVRDMAGSDPLQKIADFDRHYMPEGQRYQCISALVQAVSPDYTGKDSRRHQHSANPLS